MADFNWDDYEKVDQKADSSKDDGAFNWDDHPIVEEEPSGPSMLRSGIGGAEQGLFLSSADEIRGALEAAGQSVGVKGLSSSDFGDLGFTTPLALDKDRSLIDTYKETRDKAREEYKTLQEANPGSFLTGELAGGMAVPIGAVGQIPKAATFGQKVLPLMKAGAIAGGASSVGASETEDLSQLAKEFGTGVIGGAAMGVAVPAAIGAVKGVGKAVGKIGVVGDIMESFSRGAKGEELATTKGKHLADKLLREKTSGFAKDVVEKTKEVGKKIGDIQKAMDGSGKTLNLSDDIVKLEDDIAELLNDFDPTIREQAVKLKQTLENVKSIYPDLNVKPTDVNKLRKTLQSYGPSGSEPLKETAGVTAVKASKGLDEKITSAFPEAKEANKQFSELKNVFERMGVSSNLNPGDKVEFAKIVDGLTSKLSALEKENMTGSKVRQMLDDSLEYMRNAGFKDVAEAHAKELQNVARRYELADAIAKGGQSITIFGTPRAMATGGANIAGLGVKAVKDVPKNLGQTIGELTGRLADASPEKIQHMANTFGQLSDKTAKKLSNILGNLATEASPHIKKSILFGIMQDPDYRDYINGWKEAEENQ